MRGFGAVHCPCLEAGGGGQSRVSGAYYNSSQSTEAPEISGVELSRAW